MARSNHKRKRRRNRGRFGPLFKLLCLLALVVALTAGATVFFRVETITVAGNVRYTQEEVVAATGIQMGDNLFALNKYQIDARLRQSLPYIGDVTIRRTLPSGIVITITEWDAVARIAAPDPQAAAAAQAEQTDAGAGQSDAEKEQADGSQAGDTSQEEEPLAVAREPWLINVKGKLLEPAPGDSAALTVTGLTPLMPQAGTQLAVPQSEQFKLDALLSLLGALDEAGMVPQISSIRLGSTQVDLRYLDRFDVKLSLDGDFRYHLQVLQKVEAQIEEKHGPDATGTMDLTQEGYDLVYSPGT